MTTARPNRNLSDRDLRTLSMDDFLSLLQDDIRELDTMIRSRRRPDKEAKPRRTIQEVMDELPAPDPDRVPLHAITCCGHHMGDFPAWARVRCPFCAQWHRGGDYPETS